MEGGDRSSDRTSMSLLARVRSDDPSAWQRLTGIYGPLVYGWCRSAGVPAQDASDILQDVFASVHRGLGDFRRDKAGQSFRGWLWTITRNRTNDYFRRSRRQPVSFGGSDAQLRWGELPESEPVPDDASSAAMDATLLRGLEYVRVEFREPTWLAFWKTTVEGIATADVAAELAMSSGAVRKARFRVLRRLREELAGLL